MLVRASGGGVLPTDPIADHVFEHQVYNKVLKNNNLDHKCVIMLMLASPFMINDCFSGLFLRAFNKRPEKS